MIVAIIPARGGSKRIPGKNIIDFCGRPLLAWTIEQAKRSNNIEAVYVSTDDGQIALVATRHGAEVIMRPKEIAGDYATSEEALTHAVTEIRARKPKQPIDYVVFLQATSPLRETKDIDNAISKIVSEKADSLFSGAALRDFYIWEEKEGMLESMNYDFRNRKRSQDFKKQYVENGSMYIFKPEVLFRYENRMGGKIVISEMEFWKSFEIDEPEDVKLCEHMFRFHNLDKETNRKTN